jgi:hypothetical protein
MALTKDSSWWDIVPHLLERLRIFHTMEPEAWNDFAKFEKIVIQELTVFGINRDTIDEAMNWVENASNHTGLSDLISIFSDSCATQRVAHPMEDKTLPDSLLPRLNQCRARGILGSDIIERMLENLRGVDTSDWDDQDVESYIAETITFVSPGLSINQAKQMLGPHHHERYH